MGENCCTLGDHLFSARLNGCGMLWIAISLGIVAIRVLGLHVPFHWRRLPEDIDSRPHDSTHPMISYLASSQWVSENAPTAIFGPQGLDWNQAVPRSFSVSWCPNVLDAALPRNWIPSWRSSGFGNTFGWVPKGKAPPVLPSAPGKS